MWSSEEIVQGWFARRDTWFSASRAADRDCRRRFMGAVVVAAEGGLDHWEKHGHGALALVLLLDPIAHRVYRNLSLAYDHDRRARSVTLNAMGSRSCERLDVLARAWLFHPLACSERQADQELAQRLYAGIGYELEQAGGGAFLREAEENARVIAAFGRFPERNKVLGRRSTPAELLYLASRTGVLQV